MNTSIIDLNSISRNRNIATISENRRELVQSTADLGSLSEKQKIYSDALNRSTETYSKNLKEIPNVAKQFITALTDIKNGDEKLVAQYGLHKDALAPLVKLVQDSIDPYEQALALQLLQAGVSEELATTTSLGLKGMKESVDTVVKSKQETIEYTKSLMDNAVEIDKNRLAIVKLADTIESSMSDAITNIMDDFTTLNSSLNDFVNGLAKIANQSISNRFLNMIQFDKFSRLASAGSTALRQPEDYKMFMETAGMKVGDIWRNEFITGGEYVKQSIIGGFKYGTEETKTTTATGAKNSALSDTALAIATARAAAGLLGPGEMINDTRSSYDRTLKERYEDVMWDDMGTIQKGLAYAGETILEGAEEVNQGIAWGAKQVKKGFSWYSDQMSTQTGRIIEQLGVMYLITRGNIDDFKATKAGEFASIGAMFGTLLGPGGSLLGALIGQQLGRYVKDPIAEQTETESQKLEDINDTLKVSLAELEYVNRNLYAMRQTNDPYPVREAYYFRPYEFGDGAFSKSGGMSWGKANSYANSGSGQPVTVNGGITINVPSGNPQAIVSALSDAFSLQNIRVYQGA